MNATLAHSGSARAMPVLGSAAAFTVVLRSICVAADIPRGRILSKDRHTDVMMCRQIAIWYLRERCGVSKRNLRRYFRCSRGTVEYAEAAIAERLRIRSKEQYVISRMIDLIDARIIVNLGGMA